ncbi:hypothetical protein CTI14_69415, partial [Methylobacterium radiotolerans]
RRRRPAPHRRQGRPRLPGRPDPARDAGYRRGSGLAFAIPAETVRGGVDQLRTDGKVARGYLGVQIQPVTQDIAEGL